METRLVETVFEEITDFDTEDIFECGQCFRWRRQPDGSYTGIVESAFANVSFEPNNPGSDVGKVRIWSNLFTEDEKRRRLYWRHYFDLDRDYAVIKRLLSTEDAVMTKAVQAGGGIRILNQNKWETLISFILSQNNNIPRIQGCIESLCREHGRHIGTLKGEPLYSFPTLKRLSEIEADDLASCRLGYRAGYIVETARMVANDGGRTLENGATGSTRDIEEYLLSLSGVGPKVANCIMLFSMKKTEVFPIDVWMRRIMSGLYVISERNMSVMQDFAARNFGEYGGIAQQYLFNYIRKMKKDNPVAYARLGLDKERPEPEEGERII